MKTFLAFAWLFVLGCAPASMPVCEPRTLAVCSCTVEGRQFSGSRLCADDGSNLGVCECGERCPTSGANVRPCACDAGTGLQYCQSDRPGAVWSACSECGDAGD